MRSRRDIFDQIIKTDIFESSVNWIREENNIQIRIRALSDRSCSRSNQDPNVDLRLLKLDHLILSLQVFLIGNADLITTIFKEAFELFNNVRTYFTILKHNKVYV